MWRFFLIVFFQLFFVNTAGLGNLGNLGNIGNNANAQAQLAMAFQQQLLRGECRTSNFLVEFLSNFSLSFESFQVCKE